MGYHKDVYGQDWKDTAIIVSGGGGGIFSEGNPDPKGHDNEYGFMDLTLSKGELEVESFSWQTRADKISVEAGECSGSFHVMEWSHNNRQKFSGGQGCSIFFDEDEGWVLNNG